MKTKYRFIEFRLVSDKPKIWECCNTKSNDVLGCVDWFVSWRQFVFNPENLTTYSHDCLTDIAHFLQQLNIEEK